MTIFCEARNLLRVLVPELLGQRRDRDVLVLRDEARRDGLGGRDDLGLLALAATAVALPFLASSRGFFSFCSPSRAFSVFSSAMTQSLALPRLCAATGSLRRS